MDNLDELTSCVSEVLKICFSGSLAELKQSVQKLLLVDSPELNKHNNESNQKIYNKYKSQNGGEKFDVDSKASTGNSDTVNSSDATDIVNRSDISATESASVNRLFNGNDVYLTSLELSALEFIRDSKKHCVAHIAAAGGNLEVLQTILTSLPNLAHVEDEEGENALFYSIRSLNNCGGDDGDSANESSINNKLDCLLLLIGHCGVNCMNKNGASALHIACELGDCKIVKILLENNANVNIYSDYLGTPLNVSVARGYSDIMELLLENGADPNISNGSDDKAGEGIRRCPPAIVFASSTGQLEIVKKLLENGADVDLGDQEGWTALHCASESGYLEIVKLLIKYKANTNIKIDGKNPYYLAVYNGHLEVAEYLKSYTNPSDIIEFVHTGNSNMSVDEDDKEVHAELIEEGLDEAQKQEYRNLVNEAKDSGNQLVKVKDYENATVEYTKAIKICPVGPNFSELKSILYSNRSFTNLKLKKYKEALEDSQQSIKLNPNWSKAYLRTAHVYRETGEVVDYLHNLFQAFVKDSENKELRKLFQTEFNKYRSS